MGMMPPWSYSSLTAFETCPKRYHITRVQKLIKEPPTEATIWGVAVHEALEFRIKDKTPLPKGMEHYEKYCVMIENASGDVFTETKFCLTSKVKPTEWDADDAWCRGIVDIGIINGTKASVLDWKTGKIKPDSAQLKLFAAFIFHAYPEVQSVSTGFIWLKEDKLTKEVYTREQLPEIWNEFVPRVRRVMSAYMEDKWEAKPSGLCGKWCPVGKALCTFCGK